MSNGALFPATLVVAVTRALESAGVPAWVSGGWGIDALIGRQTRDHHDLDLAVEEQHVTALVDALASVDFRPDGEQGSRLADPAGHAAVLHHIRFDAAGAWQELEWGSWHPSVPVDPVDARGTIDGIEVPCAPIAVHAARLEVEFIDSDVLVRDRLLLREHFGIPMPETGPIGLVEGVIPPAGVAAAYMRYHDRAFPGLGTDMVEVDGDPDEWASALVIQAMGRIEYGWEIILALVAGAVSHSHRAFVAAGPVEDYIAAHGEAVIERVEARAAADPWFRDTLTGVWQNSMSHEVFARVRRAAGNVRS